MKLFWHLKNKVSCLSIGVNLFFLIWSLSTLTQPTCDRVLSDLFKSEKYPTYNHIKSVGFINEGDFVCLEKVLQRTTSPDTLAFINQYKGLWFYSIGDADQADSLFVLATEYSKKNKNAKGSFHSSIMRCVVDLYLSNEDKFVNHYKQAILNIDTSKNTSEFNFSKFIYAQYLMRMSKQDQALSLLLSSIENIKKLEDDRLLMNHYNSIATIYAEFEMYNEAKKYLLQGVKKSEEVKDSNYLFIFNVNLAQIYQKETGYDKALEIYKTSLDYFLMNRSYANASNLYLNISDIYSELKQFDSANIYYDRGINISKGTQSEGLMARLQLSYGLSLIKQQRYQEAKKQIIQSLDVIKRINAYNYEQEAYEGLSEINSKLGLYIEAFKNLQRANEIKELLNEQKREQKIRELEERYENEITRLENKRLLEEVNRKSQFIKLISIITFLSIFIVGSFFYYKINLKSQKLISLRKQLDYEKEIVEQAKQRISSLKNEILEKNAIINEISKENTIIVDEQLTATMAERLSSEKNWSQFMIEFDIIYEGFLDRMKKKFSALTNNDLRFLMLHKLKLSDKEIADLFNVAYESVRRIRYRIKDKLNVDRFEDILNF